MAITIKTLKDYKTQGRRFAMLTAYDSTFARVISQAGVEAILVGDSLGNVIQGQDSTLPVTLKQMCYHTRCVARGNQGSLIVADVPFMAAATLDRALATAARLMQCGAQIVKLEGGAWLAETIAVLLRNGVPVCAHLGLTPQSVHALGGYRVQGREPAQARQLLDAARQLDAAGAALFVLECVPRALAAEITAAVQAPVIGIGAGPDCDGQVLVMHDMLGLHPEPARFVRNFMPDAAGDISAAFSAYHRAVVDGAFPADEHCF